MSENQKTDLTLEEEYGPSLLFGYKVLICLISVGLFLLLASVVTFISSGGSLKLENISNVSLNVILIVVVMVLVIMALLVTYIISASFCEKGDRCRYCQLYDKYGLIVLSLALVILVILAAYTSTKISGHAWIASITAVIAGILAFIPIQVTWNIKSEQRLVSFIDSIARTCTCLTFIGGGIVLILQTLIGAS